MASASSAAVPSFISSKLNALSRHLDERVNLKSVHRLLQAVAKVLIVTTFFEDALRVLLTFSVQQNSMRIAGWQSPAGRQAGTCCLQGSQASPANS